MAKKRKASKSPRVILSPTSSTFTKQFKMHSGALPPARATKMPKQTKFGVSSENVSQQEIEGFVNSKKAHLLSTTMDSEANYLYDENT